MIEICQRFAQHGYNQCRDKVLGIQRISPIGECIYRSTINSSSQFPHKLYHGTQLSRLGEAALLEGKITAHDIRHVLPTWYPNAYKIVAHFARHQADSVLIVGASNKRAYRLFSDDRAYVLPDGAEFKILEIYKISEAWKNRCSSPKSIKSSPR